jgi:NAD(P)-dependent dehydrogenase (short-subunit alcohol dehydrogenase family)
MNKTVLLTGSTDGIGLQTAKELSKKQYDLIIHGRNPEKVGTVIQELKKHTDCNNIYGVVADFSNLTEVSNMAKEIAKQHKKIDILINNAGIYSSDYRITNDGFEITYQVNHLAPVLLTLKLLDNVKRSDLRRIVNVVSMAHASNIDLNEIRKGIKHSGYEAYAISKLCNILFTKKLAAITRPDNVTVNCLHPGVINTKLLKEGWGGFGADVKKGADNILYVAESDEVKDISGAYFMDKKPMAPAQIAFDEKIQDELWKINLDQLKSFL